MSQSFNFKNAKILIIGDVMLDQYWHGGTSRISPEAPVPIVHVSRWDDRPGGAANVALGVAALGATPYLLGLLGNDAAADTLENLISKHTIKCQLVRDPAYTTITKLRILSRNHQMIRLDREEYFSKRSEALQREYLAALNDTEIVILSDYGKGTLANAQELIFASREKNIPVIVDPKSRDFSLYRGATVLTPNLKEFEAVAGPCATLDILVEKAKEILLQYQMGALVITRSEHGISVVSKEGSVSHISAVAREVHDVTGAGDTVVAVLAAAMASGMDVVEAATLGNIAAGIVVGKLGTATVTAQELELVFANKEQIVPLGVMTEEALAELVQIAKSKGERIVFTNGCFDILHAGHVQYLEQAKRLGDRVIVGINDDASVARLKGPKRPVNTLENRMNVLAGLRSVDWVVPFSEDTPERIIQHLAPHVLVKGGDYKNPENLAGAKFVLSRGGKVHVLGLKEGCSTTRVIETIAAQKEPSKEPVGVVDC